MKFRVNLTVFNHSFLLLIFAFLCTFFSSSILASTQLDIFQDPFLETLIEESPSNLSDAIPRTRPDPTTAIDLLQFFGVIDFLRTEVLFLKTNPLARRNVLDLPIFMNSCERDKCKFLNAELFYNFTSRYDFTYDNCNPCGDYTSIDNYLGITQTSLIEKAQAIAAKIQESTMVNDYSVNVERLLALFKNMTIQQRQFGFMFQGGCDTGCFSWTLMLPLYYLERNFFLTDAEQANIRQELGDNQDSEMSFACQHLISDKLGFGDLRLNVDNTLYHSRRWRLNVGGQITVPSSFPIMRGLFGSAFFKRTTRPTLDILSLLEGAIPPAQAQDSLQAFQQFGFNIIDNLSANLLEAPLGNRSVGLALYIKNKSHLGTFIPRPWANNVRLKSVMRLEYEFPYWDLRSFVNNKNPAAFDALNFNDASQAGANLAFLESKFVDFFFPYVFETKVHPGIIAQWTNLYGVRKHRWDFSFGTDTWLRSGERLTNINVQETYPGTPSFDNAPTPFAYQSKIWATICYKVKKKRYDFMVTLDGDYTFAHSGIGADYTVGLNVEINF